MREWVAGAAARRGASAPIELARFGAVWASAAPAEPDVDFLNSARLLRPADAHRVDEIVAWYRARGVRPWFELAPHPETERLTARLAAAGARHTGFHTTLYGRPSVPPVPAGVSVRRIGADGLPAFAAVLLAGHEVPDAALAQATRDLEHFPSVPGWSLYLAEVDGRPAGAAVLRLADGLAYLANAATVPALRRRGAQAALVAARIADARDAGYDLVFALAAWASGSMRNLERAGLRVAYTQAVWRAEGP